MDNVLELKWAHSGSDSYDLPSPKGKASRVDVQEGAVVLDSSSEEMELWESDRQAAIEKVKMASAVVKSSPWSLGWSLVDLKDHYEKREEQEQPTDKQLSDLLQLDLRRLGSDSTSTRPTPIRVSWTKQSIFEFMKKFGCSPPKRR